MSTNIMPSRLLLIKHTVWICLFTSLWLDGWSAVSLMLSTYWWMRTSERLEKGLADGTAKPKSITLKSKSETFQSASESMSSQKQTLIWFKSKCERGYYKMIRQHAVLSVLYLQYCQTQWH